MVAFIKSMVLGLSQSEFYKVLLVN